MFLSSGQPPKPASKGLDEFQIAASNGGIALPLQAIHLMAAVAELLSLGHTMLPDLDFDVGETDPVRKLILLALCMAHEDGATAVAFGPPQIDGSSTLLRYEDEGAWHDFPPLPAPMPSVATELERMAGISQVTREGILDRTVAGARMRWRVAATAPGAEYLLTPLPE